MAHEAAYDSAPWMRFQQPSVDDSQCLQADSLPALLSEAAARWDQRIAFTACMPNGMSGSLQYRRVEELSDAFAVYLREELRLEPGSRVAVQMPNCLAFPVVAFGILKAGCVLVNTNPLYTAREMAHQFSDSGARAVVIVDMFLDKLEQIQPQTDIRHVISVGLAQWFPPVVRVVMNLVLRYWNRVIPRSDLSRVPLNEAIAAGEARLARGARARDGWNHLGRDDTAVLQYTGGTTGVSKGAVLTHGNLLANIHQLEAVAGTHIRDGEECVLTALPLYHIFAFTVNLLAFYVHGGRNVLVPNPRPIQNLQRAIENYPISWISGVNTLYNALLNEEWFSIYPPRSLRVAVAGGTALQQAVAERWLRVTGCPIAEGYGLTETAPLVSFNPIGPEARPGSIGVPAPGTEVRLVDDNGCCVPQGEPGELVVRGPQVMQGYWRREEETREAMRDGWFHTGDIATMDDDGFFRIVDRKKDMILVSGFNVYPNEVEDCLARLDKVHESAVVGIPDAERGEAVCAYVVARDPTLTVDEVLAHCRRELAAYKVPRKVVFRSELPKTPVGKVLRKELRGGSGPVTAPGRQSPAATGMAQPGGER